MKKIARIHELVDLLNRYSYEYYTLDNPTKSDEDYDLDYTELKNLENEVNYILENSPTQRIGGEILKEFEKYTHKAKLWSLDKAQTLQELIEWDRKIREFIKEYNKTHTHKLPEPEYVISKKFDGLTLNCTFSDNDLITGATRGTGEIGENVTAQAKTILNLPKSIKNDFNFEVHGETLMTKKAFEEYNAKNATPLKNLRNGAAGALRNLDTKETAKRKLIAYFYDIGYIEDKEFKTYIEMLDFIRNAGLPVDDYVKVCNTVKDIENEFNYIKNIRDKLSYDIDGIVIAINDIRTREAIGYTIKFPKWALAFKFDAEEARTFVRDVEWNVGRSGRVSPTALLDAVDIMGTTVKRATLNNLDDIERKGVKINAEVLIRRSNDVIPEILKTFKTEGATDIIVPTHCPSCTHKLIQEGPFLYCRNSLECRPQLVKSISHYCSREAMDLRTLNDKTIETLVENNFIRSISNLYDLEKDKEGIVKLERFGEKKFQNIIDSIKKSKSDRKLCNIIYGLGISEVGKKTAQDLCKHFNDEIEDIKKSNIEEFLQVKDVGEVIANNLYEWFNDEENLKILNYLLNIIVIKKEEENIIIEDNFFSGKTVVVTGSLKDYSRNEIKDLLSKMGANITGSVSKKTDFVICGEEAGSKMTKAEELNIKIILEDELLSILKS